MTNVFKIVALAILLGAVAGGVYLVGRNQQLQRGATQAETSAQVLPTSMTVSRGMNFNVSLWVNTGKPEDKLTGMEMTVNYDPSKLKFVSFQPMSGYTLVNDAASLGKGTGAIKLSLVAMGTEQGGAINYGTMTFMALNGNAIITAGIGGKLMISGQSSTWAITSGQQSNVTITGDTAVVTCIPRPACLDANPKCAMPERSDYCPKTTVTLGKICTQDTDCNSSEFCYANEANCPAKKAIKLPNGQMIETMSTCAVAPKCTAKLKENATCEGVGRVVCADGLRCDFGVPSGTTNRSPNSMGKCIKDVPVSGISCASTGKCPDGYTCQGSSPPVSCTVTANGMSVCSEAIGGGMLCVKNTDVKSCGKRCTSDSMCGSGQTCTPIWWPCQTLPADTKVKVQGDQSLSQSDVSSMTAACPMTNTLVPKIKQNDGTVKMPLFYGVCRNTGCASSVNCNCLTQIQPFSPPVKSK